MPSILITTSRKTSNRIRSFARDLWSVIPTSDRFNRGGMGLGELVSRIASSGAQAAIVISTWRGNPGDLTFLLPDGSEPLVLRVESAMLRREVKGGSRVRVSSLGGVLVRLGSGSGVLTLGKQLAALLHTDLMEAESPPGGRGQGEVLVWLEELSSGKILWTHIHAHDGEEIGPRIRIKSIAGEVPSES